MPMMESCSTDIPLVARKHPEYPFPGACSDGCVHCRYLPDHLSIEFGCLAPVISFVHASRPSSGPNVRNRCLEIPRKLPDETALWQDGAGPYHDLQNDIGNKGLHHQIACHLSLEDDGELSCQMSRPGVSSARADPSTMPPHSSQQGEKRVSVSTEVQNIRLLWDPCKIPDENRCTGRVPIQQGLRSPSI